MELLILTKGDTIDLQKHAGKPLQSLKFGLGWDVADGGPDIDLDASAVLFDGNNQEVGVVYFKNLNQFGVTHSGDNLTGAGDGDDELITVDIANLDAKVQGVVFIVNSYSGQNFSQVQNIGINIYDGETGDKLASFANTDLADNLSMYVGSLKRTTEGFDFKAIGETRKDADINAMRPHAAELIVA